MPERAKGAAIGKFELFVDDNCHHVDKAERNLHGTYALSYRSLTSGPLLDQIDILTEVLAVRYRDLADRSEAESSAEIAGRVERSRDFRVERFKGTKIHCNAQMNARHLRKHCELDAAGNRILNWSPTGSASPPAPSPASLRLPGPSPTWRGASASASSTAPRRSSIGVWIGKICETEGKSLRFFRRRSDRIRP